jgi:hypothetical protein
LTNEGKKGIVAKKYSSSIESLPGEIQSEKQQTAAIFRNDTHPGPADPILVFHYFKDT